MNCKSMSKRYFGNPKIFMDIKVIRNRYLGNKKKSMNCKLLCKRYVGNPKIIKNFNVRFEVFTAVTMKNGVFWVVTPCGSCF
jgi:hypothetical protein